MTLLRREIGSALRRYREAQRRTLRDVAAAAGVSLGYLSEVERGVKEPSSELLAAICRALDVRLSAMLADVADVLGRAEAASSAGTAAVAPALVPVEAVGAGLGAAHDDALATSHEVRAAAA